MTRTLSPRDAVGRESIKTKDSPSSVVEVDELPVAWGGFLGLESCPGASGRRRWSHAAL